VGRIHPGIHPRFLGDFGDLGYQTGVVGTTSAEHVRADILSLVHRGLGFGEFSRAAARALRRGVPFDGICVLTMDPATLLPTGEIVEDGLPPAATPRLTEIETSEPDVNKFQDLARAALPAATLSQATGGELARSRRHRELRAPSGFQDELRATFVGDTGAWGALTLLRKVDRADFGDSETKLVASLSPLLAEGLRRSILLGDVAAGGSEDPAVGLLLFGEDGSLEALNPAARMWLEELGVPGDPQSEDLPVAVRAVAGRARSASAGEGDSVARVRVRTPAGRWLLVRGSTVATGRREAARVTVMIEEASPPQLAPLIADAYGLTERERIVTQLVARGLSTREISEKIHISPYTVQDHLKSIFEKVEVKTRGELVARLFFEHYAPRLE
jgi:DNA-binding CsgD family transcriptional regulator